MNGQTYSLTIFTIVVSITVISGLRLIFSKSVRESTYKKYRTTSYLLAAACFCLAIGNILPAYFIGLDKMPDEPFSIITTSIAASQLVLLSFALVSLYTNKEGTNKRIFIWFGLFISFILLYTIACQFQEDVTTHSLKDYFALLPHNIPALIRFIYVIVYTAGLGHFNHLFFQERHIHIREAEKVTHLLTEEIRLDWVKYSFITALVEGSCAVILIVFPHPVVDVSFWIITIIFYIVFPGYYISYGKTYNKIKKMIDDSISSQEMGKDNDEGLDQMLERFIHRNNTLFEKIETLLVSQGEYLNPDLSINEIASTLCTNRTYLANAIRQNRNQTIADYILDLRLNHVILLLKSQTDMKIEEIALNSGFNSLRTFNRNFKERYGMTPEEYRDQKI